MPASLHPWPQRFRSVSAAFPQHHVDSHKGTGSLFQLCQFVFCVVMMVPFPLMLR
jgi:hypothetical protein